MTEVSATGEISNQGDGVTQASASTDQVQVATGAGERQAWWPDGVNDEAGLKTWFENRAEGATLEKDGREAAAKDGEAAEAEAAKDDAEKPAARTDDEIKASLKEAGGIYADPKYEPFAMEFEKTGALSPESVAAAAAAFGVDQTAIAAFVDGQKAQRELAATKASTPKPEQLAAVGAINSVFTGATGAADYEAFVKWGAEGTNLTQAQRDAYDSAIDRGDATVITTLLSTFRQSYLADGNGSRRDITTATGKDSTTAPAGGVTPFGSLEEGRTAMASARYKNDPGFRAATDARYAIT